jgi:uncharacterized protein
MRYLHSPNIELDEAETLPGRFGKYYLPKGPVGLDAEVEIETAALDHHDLDGERLVVEPETVSWSFVTPREAAVLHALETPRTIGWLEANWPADALGSAADFAARAFRRGLVRLEGQHSVDPTMFADSANVEEGRLVELLLTEKCNLACGYCLAGANQAMPHMKAETAHRTVDLAFAMPGDEAITFEFSGGEPFLRFELMREITDYIRTHPRAADRRAYICVQTNGTLLDEERVDWIVRNEAIVGLSLDGDPASHNQSRPQVNGRESFSKVQRGVDLMQRAGIDFGVLVVLNRANAGSVEALIDFLLENGLRSLKLNPIAYLGTARAAWDRFGLKEDEILDYVQRFARLIVDGGLPIHEANLIDMTRHLVSKTRHSRCVRGHCGAGDTFNTIAADGSIYPCGRATQSPGLKLGHVDEKLDALTDVGARNEHIQAIKARRPATLDDCVVCSYRELCQSGCSAQAYERYGTVRHKTPECSYFKTMYPYLMRWLSYDPAAVGHFNHGPYFDRTPLSVHNETFLPA